MTNSRKQVLNYRTMTTLSFIQTFITFNIPLNKFKQKVKECLLTNVLSFR